MFSHVSSLHNRKKPNRFNLFAKAAPTSASVSAYLDDLEYRLQNVPTLQRMQIIKQARIVVTQHEADDDFAKLCDDPKKLETYINEQLLPSVQQLEQAYLAKRQQSQADYSVSAFVKDIAKTTATAHLGMISPLLGILASSAMVGAEYAVSNGIPAGGINECQGQGGYLAECVQGYISNGMQPWMVDGSNPLQFNTAFSFSGSNAKANLGAYIALDHCVDANTVGDAIVSTINKLQNPITNQTTDCFVNGGQFYGYQVSAVMNNMPQGTCEMSQSLAFQAIQECMSSNQAIKWNLIIAGSVIGGVIGVPVLCLLAFCAYKCARNADCRLWSRDDSAYEMKGFGV